MATVLTIWMLSWGVTSAPPGPGVSDALYDDLGIYLQSVTDDCSPCVVTP